MVTLLGFFFILANVGFLVLFMPDLVGPVSGFQTLMAMVGVITNAVHKGPSWLYYSFAFGLWM